MENEIRKHIHNILSEVANRKKPIWKKMGEIVIEMAIIIFAVSFAVFVERNREHSHEQKEVKEFLTGLRTDLRNDIHEMKEDKAGYINQAKWFKYFANEKKINTDTLQKIEWVLWNTIHLLINNGRYEGFKASGKINMIENVELRNNILDLYQETIVALTNNTAGYTALKKDFHKLLYQRRKDDGGPKDNLATLLKESEMRNYCLRLRFTGEPVRRYDSAIVGSERIIELINKEYPEE